MKVLEAGRSRCLSETKAGWPQSKEGKNSNGKSAGQIAQGLELHGILTLLSLVSISL